jgi:hypothetical protein
VLPAKKTTGSTGNTHATTRVDPVVAIHYLVLGGCGGTPRAAQQPEAGVHALDGFCDCAVACAGNS